nr:MAG TPA: hypothetical protein [Caudoviricetes sp.]
MTNRFLALSYVHLLSNYMIHCIEQKSDKKSNLL